MRFFLIISLLSITLGFSQENSDSNRITNNFSAFESNLTGAWVKNANTKIKGTVYLYDNWMTSGIITTLDGVNVSLKGLNYDTHSDSFVAKVSNDSVYMFNNANIKEVRINSTNFKRYPIMGKNKNVFYQTLAVGKDMEIIKKGVKKIKPGIVNRLTQVASPDEYVLKSTYYLLSDNELKEIKLKKKAFSKLFGDNSKTISNFISDEKLSVSDERDLQVILNYYNTL